MKTILGKLKTETHKRLKDVEVGGVFRYVGTTVEDAVRDNGFWMVAACQPAKAGQVFCVNIAGNVTGFRDEDHLVIQHAACITLEPGE